MVRIRDDRLQTQPAGMRRTVPHISHEVSGMRPEPAQLCKQHVCLRQDQTPLRRNRVESSRNLPQGGSNPSRPRQVLPPGRELLISVRSLEVSALHD
jgi:hypothetical protein